MYVLKYGERFPKITFNLNDCGSKVWPHEKEFSMTYPKEDPERRTKFLLFSGRPLLMVDRRYVEYFTDDLKPWEHYIPVKEDLSDLVDKHEWLKHNEGESLKIAARAKDYALNNFTMDAILARMHEVFKGVRAR